MRHHFTRFQPLIATGICTFAIGMWLGAYFFKETVVVREGVADTPAAMHSVNLMLDYGNGEVRTWNTVSWHEAMSVLDLLVMVGNADGISVSTDGEGKDRVVTGVSGISTNELERWQYWVNNTHEPRTAGRYFLKPGDIVVWKFAKEQIQ